MDSHNLSPFGSDLKVYILEATSPGGGGGALSYSKRYGCAAIRV